MITNNFRVLMLSLMAVKELTTDLYPDLKLKDEDGSEFVARLWSDTETLFNSQAADPRLYKIKLGRGTKEESMEDYNLEDPFLEVSVSEARLIKLLYHHHVYLVARFTSDVEETVNETGLFLKILDTDGNPHWIMIDRTRVMGKRILKDVAYELSYVVYL